MRDAACFLCWSFARCFDPIDLAPYVKRIATQLLVVCLFDREINVRRAASAAFQENVGRQGSFPNGIDIVTMADYFAVGRRSYCYKELSVRIASFSDYAEVIIRHLLELKVIHWDQTIRLLAAESLANLCAIRPELISKWGLATLIGYASSDDPMIKQGALFAIGYCSSALLTSGFGDAVSPYTEDIVAAFNRLKF